MKNLKNNQDKYNVLRKTRDELALQAHLFNLELKDEWRELEKRWSRIQADLSDIKRSFGKAQDARSKAIADLRDSLQRAYENFRAQLH